MVDNASTDDTARGRPEPVDTRRCRSPSCTARGPARAPRSGPACSPRPPTSSGSSTPTAPRASRPWDRRLPHRGRRRRRHRLTRRHRLGHDDAAQRAARARCGRLPLVDRASRPGIRDTQCGFKLFRGALARAVWAETRIDGFSFDVEVLGRARLRGATHRRVPGHLGRRARVDVQPRPPRRASPSASWPRSACCCGGRAAPPTVLAARDPRPRSLSDPPSPTSRSMPEAPACPGLGRSWSTGATWTTPWPAARSGTPGSSPGHWSSRAPTVEFLTARDEGQAAHRAARRHPRSGVAGGALTFYPWVAWQLLRRRRQPRRGHRPRVRHPGLLPAPRPPHAPPWCSWCTTSTWSSSAPTSRRR